jgi:hypothetical protein
MTGNRLREVLLWGGLALWGAAVVVLTLRSQGISAPSFEMRTLCFPCGVRGTSDVILNWILFLPLGMCVAWLRSFRAAVAASLLVTIGIEVLQMLLPGRMSTLQDVVSNTLGGVTGAWLVSRPHVTALRLAASTTSILLWLLPAILLRPLPSERALFGQWTSRNVGFQPYSGRVLNASLGGLDVPSALIDDTARVRSALRERGPVDLQLVVGETPRSLSPILGIYDRRQREQLVVGTLRGDLVLRRRSIATAVRLDQPDARWEGALAGVLPGDTVSIRIALEEGSLCGSVDERTRCGLSPGPGDGWAFLLNLEGGSNAIRSLMMLAWSLGVGGLLGLAFRSVKPAVLSGLALGTAGLVVGAMSPDVRAAPLQAIVLMIGVGLGVGLQPVLHRTMSFFSDRQ